jgi:hypothetical protein
MEVFSRRGLMKKPIILDNAVKRSGDNKRVFEYDYNLDLNIIQKGSIKKIFIDLNHYSNEMLTKTAVERERDDEDDVHIKELLSKTEVKRERDDEEISLLELQTKSFIKRERDDEEQVFN